MKYSKSIRQEVFVKYVCGYTPKEIAKETGIHFVTIYRWVNSWSDEYKWLLYEKYRDGSSLTELCEISGVTDKPLREWFRNIDFQCAKSARLSVASVQQENARLKEAIRQRQAELKLLSEMMAVIPEAQRISYSYPLLEDYGPNQVCRSLCIRKSNLYYRTFRRPEVTVYEKHNQNLRPAIKEICDRSIKRPSSENIRQQLMSQGFTVSKQKVLKLLHEIDPQPFRKKKCKNLNWQDSDANLLARQFLPPAPNTVWVSDITEFKTDAGTYYLCVILDLFARKVVGERLSIHKDTSLVAATFQNAFEARGRPVNLLFHNDRGAQYTAHSFRKLLFSCGAQQSFSAPGVPYDNAPMESFFASLKAEETHRFRYAGMRSLTASLRDYIFFYNERRPHTTIRNLTPIQAENNYYAEQSTANHIGCAHF